MTKSPHSSSVHPDVEGRARELLAAEYEQKGGEEYLRRVTHVNKGSALRAIERALSLPNILHEASAYFASVGKHALAEEILKPVGEPHVEDGSR